MKTRLLFICAALSCAFSASALAMTKAEYNTQKDVIAADYKTSRDKCNSLQANARDICVSESKGMQKVSRAELENSYQPSARRAENLSLAKGDSTYDTAKEKCDDLAGDPKTVCRADAKAAHVTAKQEARVLRVSAESRKLNTGMRNMATSEEQEANYKAAAARCDSMAGVAKDNCVADAKLKYGMK